jgi:hypothetical protein
MAITVGTFITDGHELSEDLSNRFSMLWDTLLDTDDGISEEAFMRLVELGKLIDPSFVKDVSRFVDATDGRFYIKE